MEVGDISEIELMVQLKKVWTILWVEICVDDFGIVQLQCKLFNDLKRILDMYPIFWNMKYLRQLIPVK